MNFNQHSILYVQVYCAADVPDKLPPDNWHPWINCDNGKDEIVAMAALRFARHRGGLVADENRLVVFSYWKGEPEYRPGFPKEIDRVELALHPCVL